MLVSAQAIHGKGHYKELSREDNSDISVTMMFLGARPEGIYLL